MSRAFVKEDESAQEQPLPERRISEHANLVTADGLEMLQVALGQLTRRRGELLTLGDDEAAREELRYVDRDIRYYDARIESAILVDPRSQPAGQVQFGARVTVHQVGDGETQMVYRIVGEDEADADAGKVSYVSPLAKALIGARVGQTVTWRRPVGDLTLTIEAIAYSD